MMPVYIKDDSTAALVATLAAERGINKQDAVRLAVSDELARCPSAAAGDRGQGRQGGFRRTLRRDLTAPLFIGEDFGKTDSLCAL